MDAYHSTHDPRHAEDLPIRGGALQGAIAIDYPAGTGGHRFDKIHIVYDGINGQLPNLDLINTVTTIGNDYMGIGTAIQRAYKHGDSYEERLKTMLHGMLVQGLGHASGPHSSFIPYHVDAITLQTVGDGWHDEMTLGRLTESVFRSLNNLLEHLHQSFFFYLLMHDRRFVSIGTYLPSAMLVAVNFTIMSIALWVQSGRTPTAAKTTTETALQEPGKAKDEVEVIEHRGMVAAVPKELLITEERRLLSPLIFIGFAHILGLTPLVSLNGAPADALNNTFFKMALGTTVLPYMAAFFLRTNGFATQQMLTLIPCISLLILGIALSTLSTLNFSLGLLIGLAASPLALVQAPTLQPATHKNKSKDKAIAIASLVVLHIFSPPAIIYVASALLTNAAPGDVRELLLLASEAWTVHSTYTALIVWLVWWPAWFVSVASVACRLIKVPVALKEGVRSVEAKVKEAEENEQQMSSARP